MTASCASLTEIVPYPLANRAPSRHESAGLSPKFSAWWARTFYLMERVDGRYFHDGALPGLESAERRAIYLAMASTLAKLHRIDPKMVGLGDFGRPGNHFARWSKQ